MRMLLGYLVMGSILLGVVCLFNLPLLAALALIRGRIGRTMPAVVLATSFAATGAYVIWTVEWTDVYRHGMPSFRYFFRTMIVYTVTLAANRLVRRPQDRTKSRLVNRGDSVDRPLVACGASK